MDQKAFEIRRSQWERIILEGNKASGSKREWCRQHGINEKSFYYWQKKIRNAAIESTRSVQAISPAPASSFVEIPVPESPYLSEDSPLHGASPELMLQINDCRIFVSGTVQEHTLRTVMKVIRNA